MSSVYRIMNKLINNTYLIFSFNRFTQRIYLFVTLNGKEEQMIDTGGVVTNRSIYLI